MNRKVNKDKGTEKKPRKLKLNKQTVKDLGVKDPGAVKGGQRGYSDPSLCPTCPKECVQSGKWC
jgi:hypothetical protein